MNLFFGTGSRFGFFSQERAFDLVNYAHKSGIRAFDTGFSYGKGLSQKRLAYALSNTLANSRDSLIISTKAGALVDNNRKKCFDSEYIQNCIDLTLQDFLGTYIDIFYLHGPSIQDLDCVELHNMLNHCIVSGKIRSVGVNTHDPEVMEHLSRGKYDCISKVMIDYNLAQQDRSLFIDSFVSSGIDVVCGTLLCQGLLVQNPFSIFLRSRSLFYLARLLLKPSSRDFLLKTRKIRYIMDSIGILNTDRTEYSLRFVTDDPRIHGVSIGMLSQASIVKNMAAIAGSQSFNVHRMAELIRLTK